jgi:hypothetical protein
VLNIMSRGIGMFVLGLLIWISVSPTRCLADLRGSPVSYEVRSSNGKYVFVMLAPPSKEESSPFPVSLESLADPLKLKSKYQTSGLYLNDGSTVALWSVDWYRPNIYPDSDGVHAFSLTEQPSAANDEALAFFEKGKLVHSYKAADLVDFVWRLPHSFSHFSWIAQSDSDEKNQKFSLTTLHGDRYVFDLRTGAIVSSRRPTRLTTGLISALALFGLSIFVWRRVRTRTT